ncbi:hypothetical protein [Mangrovihabitans endophyticus]|uniref:Uncharacterized protein n=1 Tax=Mangrovihabitans endophyticus TaxID=1751298 RepID=A0A8J3FQF5_9ACTN|nr:hypothetical protein [Mangrovihabitans endophyticus]GGL00484.1 hypothetical protein GCM10012284_38630 [Mangrovihabitans endophyticus]
MAGPSVALSPLIAASAHWLTRAYPPAASDSTSLMLVEMQARQAVTAAAWLRYPTDTDAALVGIAGPGGSALLDWRAGSEPDPEDAAEGWRTWVDEVVVSWAACLLADPALARRAVDSVAAAIPDGARPRPYPRQPEQRQPEQRQPERDRESAGRRGARELTADFRRLIEPAQGDRDAAALLRHPDLLEPVAGMHRADLLYLLGTVGA